MTLSVNFAMRKRRETFTMLLKCVKSILSGSIVNKSEDCANYIQHMVDDATNTALANFLLKCYDYEYDKILNDLMKLTVSGQAGSV